MYQQLSEILRQQIQSGQLLPGRRLPPEPELSRLYGVSRPVVRAATAILQKEGLIRRSPGRGTYVLRAAVEEPLFRMLSIAEVLDKHGLEHHSSLLSYERILAGEDAAALSLRVQPHDTVLRIARLHRAGDDPLTYAVTYLPPELARHLSQQDVRDKTIIFLLLEKRSKRRIGKATYRIHAAAANEVVAEALGLAPGSPLLFVERLILDRLGDPVQFDVFHYRPDRFTLTVDMPRNVGLSTLRPDEQLAGALEPMRLRYAAAR